MCWSHIIFKFHAITHTHTHRLNDGQTDSLATAACRMPHAACSMQLAAVTVIAQNFMVQATAETPQRASTRKLHLLPTGNRGRCTKTKTSCSNRLRWNLQQETAAANFIWRWRWSCHPLVAAAGARITKYFDCVSRHAQVRNNMAPKCYKGSHLPPSQ